MSAEVNSDAKSPSGFYHGLLSSVLSSRGYTIRDLDYKKSLVDDPNLSPLVRSILNHPANVFPAAEIFSKQLAQRPWERGESEVGDRKECHVVDWHNTPSEVREVLQALLDRLDYLQSEKIHPWFAGVGLDDKNRALRYFALESFHPDLDQNALRFWGSVSGGGESLEALQRRADQLDLSETESIEAQLVAGWKLNPVKMSAVASQVCWCLHDFVQHIKPIAKKHRTDWKFDKIFLETDLGRVVLGGFGSQRYRQDEASIIIDLGGDDTYDSAGVAYGTMDRELAIAIDLAGNDTYHSAGAGIWGFGILWDESGNDRYEAASGSLGCGLFGAGVLVDVEGNDFYRGDSVVEGAAAFGYGMLWDGRGDDRYRASMEGQAFAAVNGYGVLCDFDGDDLYYAGGKYPDFDRLPDHTVSMSQGFAIGYRPFAPGGLAILYDRKGNDEYRTDIFGQGASYWYSCGMLIDESGNDQYYSGQYDQGAGIHFSVGILKDTAGNDRYFSSYGLAQGTAHDLSVGLLWDFSGNDTYSARSASQGSGIFNGVGFLLDEKGNDQYVITLPKETNGQGIGLYSDPRGYGSVGILMDLQGADHYSNSHSDNSVAERNDFGIALDVARKSNISKFEQLEIASLFNDEQIEEPSFEFGEFVTDEIALPPRNRKEIIKHGGDRHLGDLLIHSARSGDLPWKVRDRKQAHDELSEVPVEAYDEMLPWLGLSDPMVRNEIEVQINQKEKAALPVLRQYANDDWVEVRAFCLKLLEQKGDASDVPLAVKGLKEKKTRVASLLLIAKFGAGEYAHKIRPYLHGERGVERALSIKILGSNEEMLPSNDLICFLEDPDWNVRRAAVKAFQLRGPSTKNILKRELPTLSPLGQYWGNRIK